MTFWFEDGGWWYGRPDDGPPIGPFATWAELLTAWSKPRPPRSKPTLVRSA